MVKGTSSENDVCWRDLGNDGGLWCEACADGWFRIQPALPLAGPLGPVSQRFSKDELQCFKRIPGPSSNFDEKLSVYWQSAGGAAWGCRHGASSRYGL